MATDADDKGALEKIAVGLDMPHCKKDDHDHPCHDSKLLAAGFSLGGIFRSVVNGLSGVGMSFGSILNYVPMILDLLNEFGPEVQSIIDEVKKKFFPPAPAPAPAA